MENPQETQVNKLTESVYLGNLSAHGKVYK